MMEDAVTGETNGPPVLGVKDITVRATSWGAIITVTLADGNEVHADWFRSDGRVEVIGVTVWTPRYLGTIVGSQGYLAARLDWEAGR